MKQLVTRTIFGAIYVAAIVGGIIGGKIPMLILLLMLCTLGIDEFLTVTHRDEADTARSLAVRLLDCAGACTLVLGVWANLYMAAFLLFAIYLIWRMTIQLYIKGQNPIKSVALSMMGHLYVTVPIVLMAVMGTINKYFLLSMFILVWVNDTFAYLTGSMLGRHKLWERISPKKSWEGFIGGAVFCIVASVLLGVYWTQIALQFTPLQMAFVGLLVAIFGTLGDLFESLLKRTLGVKDSGNIIPGHGGILDRIDSILFVIPVTLTFMFLLLMYGII